MTPSDPLSRYTPDALSGTLLAVGTVLLFLAGRALFSPMGVSGVAVAEWMFLALPVVVALRFGGFDLIDALGFARVSRTALLGGALLMFGGLSLNWLVAWAQSRWIPVPEGVAEAMAEAFRADSALQMLGLLFAAALTPAICEEVVFRGLLLRAWRRWPASLAIGLNALAFGALHWIPGTAFRVLPAATSGALIAWAVWRTRSLWVGIWMHLLNNGFLLLASSLVMRAEETVGGEVAAVGSTDPPPLAALLPMLAIAALGVHLLRTDSVSSPSRSGDPRVPPDPDPK